MTLVIIRGRDRSLSMPREADDARDHSIRSRDDHIDQVDEGAGATSSPGSSRRRRSTATCSESVDLLGEREDQRVRARARAPLRARAAEGARAGRGRARTRTSPRCCSSASTTPAAARWRPASSSFAPRGGFTSARRARRRRSEINPAVIEAMNELGVDMSEEFPKPLTDEVVQGRRRRDHDGLRRCLPDLPGQEVRGLGARRPRRPGPRDGAR